MPVRETDHTENSKCQETIYQRAQYEKGGIGRYYWDFRDSAVFREIPLSAGVILDAGCGEGITLEKLVRLFYKAKVSGIDILDENIAICKKYGLPASKGNLAQLDLPDNSIDCCLLMEVIEHIAYPEAVLREVFRILKTGGSLITVYPNDAMFACARLATLKLREALYDPGHVRQWTPGAIKKMLDECGYRVGVTKCVPFVFWPISLHGITVASKP